jgi:hypothetical protein
MHYRRVRPDRKAAITFQMAGYRSGIFLKKHSYETFFALDLPQLEKEMKRNLRGHMTSRQYPPLQRNDFFSAPHLKGSKDIPAEDLGASRWSVE